MRLQIGLLAEALITCANFVLLSFGVPGLSRLSANRLTIQRPFVPVYGLSNVACAGVTHRRLRRLYPQHPRGL